MKRPKLKTAIFHYFVLSLADGLDEVAMTFAILQICSRSFQSSGVRLSPRICWRYLHYVSKRQDLDSLKKDTGNSHRFGQQIADSGDSAIGSYQVDKQSRVFQKQSLSEFKESIHKKFANLYSFDTLLELKDQKLSLSEAFVSEVCHREYLNMMNNMNVHTLVYILNMAQFYNSEDDFIIELLCRGKTCEAYCIFRFLTQQRGDVQRIQLILLSTLSKLLAQKKIEEFALFFHIYLTTAFEDNQATSLNEMLKDFDFKPDNLTSRAFCEKISQDAALCSDIADFLICLTLRFGDPLISAAICMRFYPSIYVKSRTLYKLINSLAVYDADKGYLHMKALVILLNTFPKGKIYADAYLKRRIINTVLQMCRHRPPTFVNEMTFFTLFLPGDQLPTRVLYQVLEKCIANDDESNALMLWKIIKTDYSDFTDHGIRTLSALLHRFSRDRRLMGYAREIVHKIPPNLYDTEGISEALIMYCVRDNNLDLARDICGRLKSPFRRTILTSLLHLHLFAKDEKGTEAILKEISNHSVPLQEHELALIVKSLAKGSLTKAVQLLDKVPKYNNSPSVLSTICNCAIDTNQDEFFYKYFEKLLQVKKTSSFGISSQIIAKKINNVTSAEESRRLWLYWTQIGPRIPFSQQVRSLRLFLSRFCKLDYTEMIVWALKEYEELGYSRRATISLLKNQPSISDEKLKILIKMLTKTYC